MARVGFIGVGNMGSLMARNLIKAGHSLKMFDLNDEAVNFVVQSGAERVSSAKEASRSVDFVVSMLPVGANVRWPKRPTPLGATATAAFSVHVANGVGDLDLSSIVKLINPDVPSRAIRLRPNDRY